MPDSSKTFNKSTALAAMRRNAAASVDTSQSRAIRTASRWREQLNPMRNLSMPNAVRMLEAAATGMYADLQWTYASPDLGIEAADPDLNVIIERTISGLSECSWQVKIISDDTRGFDKVLADEQESALREMYENCKNLKQSWEHLTMARFRGFSHLNPWHRADGSLERLEPLPQYAMVRQSGTNNWAFNPDCRQMAYESVPPNNRLDRSEYILMQSPRSVNRIGLAKTIRANTAEKDWDAFVETYGLPGVFIIMPQNIPLDEQEFWLNAAGDAADGGNGVLPFGADAKTLAEARGSQPFFPRLEWLQKQLVLVGTGGLLNGLAVAGSGTLAGSVHAQAFREIIRRQAALINECFQEALDSPRICTAFPGYPVQAYFEIEAAKERDVTGVVTNISTLAAAGYYVDPKQVEEDSGYKITLFQPLQQQPAMPAITSPQAWMSALRTAAAQNPEEFARAIRANNVRQPAPSANQQLVAAAQPHAAKALSQDLTPLADEIKALLDKSDDDMISTLFSTSEKIPALMMPAGDGELEKIIEGTMTAALLNGAQTSAIERQKAEKPPNRQPEADPPAST